MRRTELEHTVEISHIDAQFQRGRRDDDAILTLTECRFGSATLVH